MQLEKEPRFKRSAVDSQTVTQLGATTQTIVSDRTEQDVLLKPPIALTLVNPRVSGRSHFNPGRFDLIASVLNSNESLIPRHFEKATIGLTGLLL
jgi:hypothetical protein